MSQIKEILCLHHSHLDVGYTHPQPMILELQQDYIDQAIDLCLRTLDWPEESCFRWTCEVTYPLKKWLETASPEWIRLFRRLVEMNRISVAALPMHTTPGCTMQQFTWALRQLDEIRERTGSPITTAINHDVNGQPWTLADMMLDSGIQFYITAINIHFGGIPFPRPYAFRWETQDGRQLPSFVGEHYSMFNSFIHPESGDTGEMEKGIREYLSRIEQSGWKEDFVYLTAANPPLCDNNGPDATLAEMIRRYNEEGHGQIIRFATPEMLKERILKNNHEALPIHRGDWTDYWNFGCASTAMPVRINRAAKNILKKVDFLESLSNVGRLGAVPEAVQGEGPDTMPGKNFGMTPEETLRETVLTDRAYENTLLFDEHTWGYYASVTDPDEEETCMQQNHKAEYVYNAADLSSYLLGRQMERLAGNPVQSDRVEGLIVANPTALPMRQRLKVSRWMVQGNRMLAADRIRNYLPYVKKYQDLMDFGSVEVAPFSVKKIPVAGLREVTGQSAAGCSVEGERIETPFYRVELWPDTRRIRQIYEKSTGRNLLNPDSEWGFFDLVEERVDTRFHREVRLTFFRKNIDEMFRNISQWNHEWRAERRSITKQQEFHTEETAESVTLYYRASSKGISCLEQRITFLTKDARILLDVTMVKKPVEEPESVYFAFPLALEAGWQCVYDTADTYIRLDDDQLGSVCRDYLTVDKGISLYDGKGGFTLACPDAPMVQVGGFQFGKENRSIERTRNPLLLAWPLNNIWDTNFAASQEGRMYFHYELCPFEKFDVRDMYRNCVQAASPCAVGAAVACGEEKEWSLLQTDSEHSIPVVIRPMYGMPGIFVAVKNESNEESRCTITVPGAGEAVCISGEAGGRRTGLKSAAVTDLQGNVREHLKIDDNGICFCQRPFEVTYLWLVV